MQNLESESPYSHFIGYILDFMYIYIYIYTEWVNLTQMTIISTTVSKNPLEEME